MEGGADKGTVMLERKDPSALIKAAFPVRAGDSGGDWRRDASQVS